MRSWIYDVEFDLQKNGEIRNKKQDNLWLLSYLVVVSITLVYIIQCSFNKSSTTPQQHWIFIIVICVFFGCLFLFSIGISVYYLRKLQTIQVEPQPLKNTTFNQRQSIRGQLGQNITNHHHSGIIQQNKLTRQNTGKMNASGKWNQKFDSNQSSEDLKNNGNNQNLNIQRSSSKLGSPKNNKDNQKSISSQNSLNMQQQPNQIIQKNNKKGSLLQQQKQKEQNIMKGGKEYQKAASGVFNQNNHNMTEESNIYMAGGMMNMNNQNKQNSFKYFFITQLINASGCLVIAMHVGFIYFFFARSPFWNTTQIWNGICLFALYPTHILAITIFVNANFNLIYDRSFFIQCISSNYLLQIYKNSFIQIGYVSMILLVISLVWGSIMQIVKNQKDIPAIILLSLIGCIFIYLIVMTRINQLSDSFRRGYRYLIEQINR